jgi:colicin import membrane protein
MSETRESSVLFSLNQLMRIEEDRVAEEERRARAEAEAREAAQREVERRARAEEEAALQADEERRRAAAAARREEEARLEALRVAEVERVRLEAERQARLALLTQQHAHEQKLAAIAEDRQKRRLRRALVAGSIAAAAIFAGAGGWFFGVVRPAEEAARLRELDALTRREAENERLRGELGRAQRAADEALAALTQAKDEVGREAARRQAEAANRALDQAKKELTVAARPAPAKHQPASCPPCKYEGDPLCDCLSR